MLPTCFPPNHRMSLRPCPKASPVLEPLSWPSTSTLTVIFDYCEVAVEIWHQILLAAIDMPYVLDTLVPREDQWRNSARYHDSKTSEGSERQRKLFRLVCRRWRDFANGYKYRWISYSLYSMDSKGPRGMDVLEAIPPIRRVLKQSVLQVSHGGSYSMSHQTRTWRYFGQRYPTVPRRLTPSLSNA
jgi:hypothetical protein